MLRQQKLPAIYTDTRGKVRLSGSVLQISRRKEGELTYSARCLMVRFSLPDIWLLFSSGLLAQGQYYLFSEIVAVMVYKGLRAFLDI